MKIVIGEIKQEANTFSPLPTRLADFEATYLLRGREIVKNLAAPNTEVGGFLDAADEAGFIAVPTIAAAAVSGGPVVQEDYERLKQELVGTIEAARPFDGVLLAFHGSMVAEGSPDADGETLAAVREAVGPDCPVVVTLDMHANVTEQMAASANGILGYRTFPHVDLRVIGCRAGMLLAETIRHGRRLRTVLEKIPMIVPPENAWTDQRPASGVIAELDRVEGQFNIQEVSYFPVQPWLDVPEMGCAITASSWGDVGEARKAARQVAELFWSLREEYLPHLVAPAEAVQGALRSERTPVILSDGSDAPSSGSPGDATGILGELLAVDFEGAALVSVVDGEAARLCLQAGVGAAVQCAVGGKIDRRFNRPVEVSGRVLYAAPTRFTIAGPMMTGVQQDMGMAAVVAAGPVRIVLTEKRVYNFDPALYRAVGLEPADARMVVAKSPTSFRGAYQSIAGEIVLVNAPGVSPSDITRLPYTRTDRTMFPFDRRRTWLGPSSD